MLRKKKRKMKQNKKILCFTTPLKNVESQEDEISERN